ncbi:SDH family Clp fold serine proteinase [Pseudooceanicola sp. 502str34]
MVAIKTDDIIQELLAQKCAALEDQLKGEVILIRAPMQIGIDDTVRREVEHIAATQGRRNQLVVVIETNGGSVEVVERLSDVFRHHFDTVIFVVPNFAYSAGTVLCLSGDAIYMDYYSVLGPIDPQIYNRDGRWVPGMGYLGKYNSLIDKSRNGEITLAEVEFLVRKFDPAELFTIEQARKHSADLIEAWLTKYKFKDWTHRETDGSPVDEDYKKQRATEIAELLGDATEWNSHGRGIPMRVLESEKLKLKIENFGADAGLNSAVREYYDLFIDYCGKIGSGVAIHTKHRLINLGG